MENAAIAWRITRETANFQPASFPKKPKLPMTGAFPV